MPLIFLVCGVSLFLIPDAYADVEFSQVDICGLGIVTDSFPFYLVCSSFSTSSSSSSSGASFTVPNIIGGTGDLIIKFTGESLKLSIGEIYNAESIQIEWQSADDIIISSIIVGESPIQLSFPITPLTLSGDLSGQSSGHIPYTVNIPSEKCDVNPTENCVQQIKYRIPITLTAVHDSTDYVSTVFVEIDLSSGITTEFPLIFFMLLIAVLLGIFLAGIKRAKKSNRKGKLHVDKGSGKKSKASSKLHSDSNKKHQKIELKTSKKPVKLK